jgi:hypothetical protein
MWSITFASALHGKERKKKETKKNKGKEAEHRLPTRVNVRVLIMPLDYESNEGLVPVY